VWGSRGKFLQLLGRLRQSTKIAVCRNVAATCLQAFRNDDGSLSVSEGPSALGGRRGARRTHADSRKRTSGATLELSQFVKKAFSTRAVLPLGVCLLSACASTKTVLPPRSSSDPIEVPRIVVTPDGTTTVAEMFARAEAKAKTGDALGAAALFDRVTQIEPASALAAEAAFRSADAHDAAGHHEAALSRYRFVVDRHPEHARAALATARTVRLLTYVGDWKTAGRYADRMLERQQQLTPFELIAAFAGKALSTLAEGDDVRASSFVARGRDAVERHQLDLAGRLPRDVAPLYFALGEIRRVRSERIRLNVAPETFLTVLEQRCQLILDAQSAYSDTWRAYDAHWSTLSGYRLGEMYAKLHEELMSVAPPPSADTDSRRQLFEGAMRLRYSVLLEKARGMLEHTLAMAEREGERSEWVEHTRKSLAAIRRAEEAEAAALARLPYTRADLEDMLAEIRKRRETAPTPQTPPKARRQN
jgi:tetratricopeptide (TPR) repeat protein